MQPSTHDLEVTGPSVGLRFPQKNKQFQSIHRPETPPGNSRVRTNPEKRPLPTCLWTLGLQGNVNRNKIQCKTRIGQNVHTVTTEERLGSEEGGRGRMGEGTRRGPGLRLGNEEWLCPRTLMPHVTDQNNRLREVSTCSVFKPQVAVRE